MSTKDTANLIYEIQRSLTQMEGKLGAISKAIKFEEKSTRLLP